MNTLTDKDIGTDEETVDLMFLASKEQEYGETEGGIYNDAAWDYYKQVTSSPSPNNEANTGRVKFGLEAQTSPMWHRLRSPNRWNSGNTWNCSDSGDLYYNNANNRYRCAPACVIA